KALSLLTGYRWFESISLQRRVRREPEFLRPTERLQSYRQFPQGGGRMRRNRYPPAAARLATESRGSQDRGSPSCSPASRIITENRLPRARSHVRRSPG